MCRFCIEHGEGNRWYLNAKNYSRELYNELRAGERLAEIAEAYEEYMVTGLNLEETLRISDPASFEAMLPDMEDQMRKEMIGQVIPLEDAESVLDMSITIVRLPCGCRSALYGRAGRFELGVFAFDTEVPASRYPDFSEDLEVLGRDEAKKLLRDFEQEGILHSIWSFKPPFINTICNCTSKDCLGIKMRSRTGMDAILKAGYVCGIDIDRCNGCRECIKVCNFGAISYSPALKRCFIDQFQCWGCGICRSVCPTGAISLTDRNAIPELAKDW